MNTVTEISATATVCIVVAITVCCCCFYYFLSKKQNRVEEVESKMGAYKNWFSLRLPFLSSRRSSVDTICSRSISTCSNQTLNFAELVRAIEEHESRQKETGRTSNFGGMHRVAIFTPASSIGNSLQEKQERFHQWLSTPSCHLTPITEEAIQMNNGDDSFMNRGSRTPEVKEQKKTNPLAPQILIEVPADVVLPRVTECDVCKYAGVV